MINIDPCIFYAQYSGAVRPVPTYMEEGAHALDKPLINQLLDVPLLDFNSLPFSITQSICGENFRI